MSEHRATVRWSRTSDDFGYESYNRAHTWDFGDGVVVPASAAPDFKGEAERVDPEEAFVASLSSCHMLTFLALCSKKRLTVDGYADAAVGTLGKNEQGRLAMTDVVLRPQVTFAGDAPGPEALQKLHQRAHEQCFIANSVQTRVRIEA